MTFPGWDLSLRDRWAMKRARLEGLRFRLPPAEFGAYVAGVEHRKTERRARRRRRIGLIAAGAGLGILAHALVPFWYQLGAGAAAGLVAPPMTFTLPLGIAAPVVGIPTVLVGGAGIGTAVGISLPRVGEAVATPFLHRGIAHGSTLLGGIGLGIVGGVLLAMLLED